MNRRLWDTYDALDREHYRRRGVATRAIVKLIDDTGPVQRLQIEGFETELHDYMQGFSSPGFSAVPLPGSSLQTLHHSGHRGFGSAQGYLDPRYRPKNQKPGEFMAWVVTGAQSDGTGGALRPILKGTVDGKGQLTGIEVDIGDANTTTIVMGSNGTVDIYGKTKVTVHAPEIDCTNGGTLHPVSTTAGPSTVLKADA
jgi:phage gp45-like